MVSFSTVSRIPPPGCSNLSSIARCRKIQRQYGYAHSWGATPWIAHRRRLRSCIYFASVTFQYLRAPRLRIDKHKIMQVPLSSTGDWCWAEEPCRSNTIVCGIAAPLLCVPALLLIGGLVLIVTGDMLDSSALILVGGVGLIPLAMLITAIWATAVTVVNMVNVYIYERTEEDMERGHGAGHVRAVAPSLGGVGAMDASTYGW